MDTVFLNKIATREWVKERDRALLDRLADLDKRLALIEGRSTGDAPRSAEVMPMKRGPGRPRKTENG